MASGVQADESCIKAFNEMKLSHTFKYIIFVLAPDNKSIVVEDKVPNDVTSLGDNKAAYEHFLTKLPQDAPRYAVFDFEFEKEDGSGKRNRIVFVNWTPDSSRVKQKMVYASSKDALRRGLIGIQVDVQATEADEVSYEIVHEKCDKLR